MKVVRLSALHTGCLCTTRDSWCCVTGWNEHLDKIPVSLGLADFHKLYGCMYKVILKLSSPLLHHIMHLCMVLVHTDTNTYGSHSCYSHVPVLRYGYCMWFESSLSLYNCTLLPICTVATVQLLYTIPILTVTISVHIVTNMYGSHS